MGNADRITRILLAAVFAYLYFSGTVTGTLGIVLVILGAVFVLTSLVSFCPLYTSMGLNTCPKKSKRYLTHHPFPLQLPQATLTRYAYAVLGRL
jgi:Protein of unknown function (DUF2892)